MSHWGFAPVHPYVFIFMIFMAGALLYCIFSTQKKGAYIRAISGLKAIEEAIGRATELGKPVLFTTGLADINDIQTLAAFSILGYVAKKTVEYDIPLLVPSVYSASMIVAQEIVKEAHLQGGRPDTYKPDHIYYVSDEQFAFAAHVSGLMQRKKPAANLFLGKYFGESLILAETGHAAGAIQIAGTAETSQLPFFIAACDYCLIGEELYAASAYLSQDPHQLGSIKAQDFMKLCFLGFLIFGWIVETLHVQFLAKIFTGTG